jgi:hypothetical protein
MRRLYRWAIAASLCAAALLQAQQSLAADLEVIINTEFKPVDASGRPLVGTEMELRSGSTVRWWNKSGKLVVITFSVEKDPRGMVHKILGGPRSIRLAPGEFVVRRAGTLRHGLKYNSYFGWPERGLTISGVGGGPDIVTPPPPPPPPRKKVEQSGEGEQSRD